MELPPETLQRFHAKYRKDEQSGCWIWTASVAGKGYGQFGLPGQRKNAYAHRLAWQLKHGDIPDGQMVCHKCDNPRCVNPDHLFLGTCRDNLKDMARKGRHLYGERNDQAKLTEEQARQILSLRGKLSQKKIAAKFGVGQMTVCRIQLGLRWKHIRTERQQA